ncbi:MAG: hypothetical protein Q4C83_03455 [Candidatus Saccharibacteria bacterium]|nr:hypothetical protein [Candidatus Saccharibacteria bacterium]
MMIRANFSKGLVDVVDTAFAKGATVRLDFRARLSEAWAPSANQITLSKVAYSLLKSYERADVVVSLNDNGVLSLSISGNNWPKLCDRLSTLVGEIKQLSERLQIDPNVEFRDAMDAAIKDSMNSIQSYLLSRIGIGEVTPGMVNSRLSSSQFAVYFSSLWNIRNCRATIYFDIDNEVEQCHEKGLPASISLVASAAKSDIEKMLLQGLYNNFLCGQSAAGWKFKTGTVDFAVRQEDCKLSNITMVRAFHQRYDARTEQSIIAAKRFLDYLHCKYLAQDDRLSDARASLAYSGQTVVLTVSNDYELTSEASVQQAVATVNHVIDLFDDDAVWQNFIDAKAKVTYRPKVLLDNCTGNRYISGNHVDGIAVDSFTPNYDPQLNYDHVVEALDDRRKYDERQLLNNFTNSNRDKLAISYGIVVNNDNRHSAIQVEKMLRRILRKEGDLLARN